MALGSKVVLPTNHIELHNPPDTSKQEKMFQLEKERTKEIAELIRLRKEVGVKKDQTRLIFKLIKPIVFRIVKVHTYDMRAIKYHEAGKRFYANESCIHCGICKSVCPVKNIEWVNKKPNWLDHCEQCMACIEWCPKKAIQCGGKTINKIRYTNPEITVKDIIASAPVVID